MTTLVVIVLVVVVLVIVGGALWWRAQRREEGHATHATHDSRLVTPPPSPYQPSQGFRLVDGESQPAPEVRPTPARPRLDARDYVFGESTVTGDDGLAAARHDSHWALERMTRHRRRKWRSRQWMRLGVVVLIVVLAAGYVLQRGHPTGPTATTSTTVSTTWPASFAATSTGIHSSRVAVPTTRFSLKVLASAPVSVVVTGATHTYAHVTLASGQSVTREVKGSVTVKLSALAVTVSLNGSPLNLPSDATAPYTLSVNAAK